MVVGGNLYFSSGQISNGDALVGGNANLINVGVVPVSYYVLLLDIQEPLYIQSKPSINRELSLKMQPSPLTLAVSSANSGNSTYFPQSFFA